MEFPPPDVPRALCRPGPTQRPNAAAEIHRYLDDPHHTEPILLALGIASHVEKRLDTADIVDATILPKGPMAQHQPDLFESSELEDLER